MHFGPNASPLIDGDSIESKSVMPRAATTWMAFWLLGMLPLSEVVAAEPKGPLLELPAAPADATDSAPAPDDRSDGDRSGPSPFAWSTLLRELADETIPRDYEVRRGWGRQTEIVSGVRIRKKNGLPRISKRTKRVNHGVWRRFRIALHRPEEKLKFAIRDVGPAPRGGLTLKVVLTARVRCTGQAEFWNVGVKAGSATTQADATIRVVARFLVSGRELDPGDGGWLVRLEYAPEIDRVRIELDDFDVRRIGHLDGDLVDVLGNSIQLLLAEVLHSREKHVTRRIQRELHDRNTRLRLTLPRALWETSKEPPPSTIDHQPCFAICVSAASIALSRPFALLSVSWYSDSGTLSATMPAPAWT